MRNCLSTCFLSIALFSLDVGFGQSLSCSDIKSGTFYSYPKNTNERWKIIRDGSTEKDINLVTGDTSVWQIDWPNECRFKMKYLSGGKLKKEEAQLFKDHVLLLSVEANNASYYLVNYYLDKKGRSPFLIDTFWKMERPATDKRIFSELQPIELRRLRFKDTSQYALLYVYRSGKFVGSLADYILKCDDIAMARMSNRSAYVFRIWKEGPLRIIGETINHEDLAETNIVFGHKYYLKCDIKLTLDNGGRPVLTFVDKEKGESGFIEAQ